MSAAFNEALEQFQGFLENNGYSRSVSWITPDYLLVTGKKFMYDRVSHPDESERRARKLFEVGITQERGVLFETVCEGKTVTFCYGYLVTNTDHLCLKGSRCPQ